MTDLLEQMKARAEQAQTAYEAYKAECERVEELPEAWYLHTDGDCGQYFRAGERIGILWNHATDKEPSHTRRFSSRSENFTACTAAEYNNARALYHGADFTGRLHEIDRPVCELNKATRDEIDGHKWSEFEVIDELRGEWGACVSWEDYFTEANSCAMVRNDRINGNTIYRLRTPKKRLMTRKEVLAWASSAEAFGWVVKWGDCDPCGPQCQSYILDSKRYQRAPIATLNDDGTGGEWETFEVQV